MVSPGARFNVPDGFFAPYEVVRELGSRANPVFILWQSAPSSGKPLAAVGERFEGAGKANDPRAAELLHEARRVSTLANPNLARVREVAVRGDDLAVFSEFLEGEKLLELWPPPALSLEIALRVVLDALSGLSALHNLRDAKQQPMNLAHGELSPATIVFGVDGVSRVLHAVARRAPGVRADAASLGYLAPEVHAGEPYDARADVFSAGVLLWEALSARRLFTETESPTALAARVRGSPLPPATVPEKAAWAKGLIDVAAKALGASPGGRWPTTAAMAAEIRKLVGLKLAPASSVSAFAKGAIADRVKSRREGLERSRKAGSAHAPAMSPAPAPVRTPAATAVSPAPPAALAPRPPAPVTAAAPRPPLQPPTRPVAPSPPEARSAPRAPSGPSLPKLPPEATDREEAGHRTTPTAALGSFVVDPSPGPAGASPVPPSPAPPPAGQAAERPAPPPVPVAYQAPPPPPPPPPLAAPVIQTDAHPPRAPGVAEDVDVHISISPPAYDDPLPTAPAVTREHDEDGDLGLPAPSRRRRAIVLGSVGAFGALVFALAGWRVSQHSHDAAASSTRALTVQSAVPSGHAPLAPPRATPALGQPVAVPAATAAVPAEPARAETAAPARSSPPTGKANPAAAAVIAPKPTATSHTVSAPAHPKPKSRSTAFDPNSL